jgi:CubicO group peptidase (beta-lactamase class C family)
MKYLISLLAWCLSLLASGQGFLPGKPAENGMSAERLSRIDQYMAELMTRKAIPGAVVFIARNGKVILHKAYGYSDVERQKAMRKDDIFRIASQSKAITSLAVMMLLEEGKFTLDEPISKYIPEFKNPRVLKTLNWGDTTFTTTPAQSEITIRQLLTHSSGIDYAGIGSQEFKAIYAKNKIPSGIGNDKDILADRMKVLGGMPLKHQPGEQFTYSLSIDVLGYLVETVSGMSLDAFFKKRIFTPLGMNDTYFYLPKEKHDRLVRLYSNRNGLVKLEGNVFDGVNVDYPALQGTYYSGGAGLSSTIEDYAKFLQLFINKGEFNGTRLLSRKTVELMLTNQLQPPITTAFGLGFALETNANDYQSVYSIGSFSWGGAFNTQYWGDPNEKLIGLIYTNIYGNVVNTAERFKMFTYSAIID